MDDPDAQVLGDTFEGPIKVRLPKAVSADTPPPTPPRQFTLNDQHLSKWSAGVAFNVVMCRGLTDASSPQTPPAKHVQSFSL